MRVIPPIDVTDAKLTYSSVPEDDYAEWAVGTTYALGDKVILTSTHRIYESLQAGNVGNNPTAETTTPPTYWLEIAVTNRWKMFDLYRNDRTTAASQIVVEITPSVRCDSLALVGLQGDNAIIEMIENSSVVYQKTLNFSTRLTSTWYEYFFDSFGTVSGVVVFDMPPFTNAKIRVTINGYTGVGIGSLALGQSVYLGEVELQAVSDSLNFSVVERNEFGDSILLPRRSIPKTNQTIFADKKNTDRLILLRDELNAKPAVWSGLDDATDGYFNALLILGYYRQFLISLEYPQHTLVQLELEEI